MATVTPLTLVRGQLAIYVILTAVSTVQTALATYTCVRSQRISFPSLLLPIGTVLLVGSYAIGLALAALSLDGQVITVQNFLGLQCSSSLVSNLFNVLLYAYIMAVISSCLNSLPNVHRQGHSIKKSFEYGFTIVWVVMCIIQSAVLGAAYASILGPTETPLSLINAANAFDWAVVGFSLLAIIDVIVFSLYTYIQAARASSNNNRKNLRSLVLIISPLMLIQGLGTLIVTVFGASPTQTALQIDQVNLSNLVVFGVTTAGVVWALTVCLSRLSNLQQNPSFVAERQELERIDSHSGLKPYPYA